MRNVSRKIKNCTAAIALAGLAMPLVAYAAPPGGNGWEEVDGAWYWYEDGVKQGLEEPGKEIYDPGSQAWYWLDSIYDGKKAVSKEVYMPKSDAGPWAEHEDGTGKWVRYDEYGHMIKGWYTNEAGNTYFYDPI